MSKDDEPATSRLETDWNPERIARVIPELRKRWVVRAITSYALGLWLTIQACDITLQVFGVSGDAMRGLVLLGLCGLPVATLAGWWLGKRESRGVAKADPRNVEDPMLQLSAPILLALLGSACLLALLLVLQVV